LKDRDYARIRITPPLDACASQRIAYYDVFPAHIDAKSHADENKDQEEAGGDDM
jgi:hypothetical protein